MAFLVKYLMPNKIIQKSHVAQLTINGAYKYPWHHNEVNDVTFTKSFYTCYYKNKTLKKVKGGTSKGGNYMDPESGDEYRISKY